MPQVHIDASRATMGVSGWISAGAIILTIISFLFNSWHNIQSTQSDESKLEVKVADVQKTVDEVKKQNGDMRVDIGILGAKIEMLLDQKSKK